MLVGAGAAINSVHKVGLYEAVISLHDASCVHGCMHVQRGAALGDTDGVSADYPPHALVECMKCDRAAGTQLLILRCRYTAAGTQLLVHSCWYTAAGTQLLVHSCWYMGRMGVAKSSGGRVTGQSRLHVC
jgi:small ligand-binding sensory domain FIST